MAQHSTYRVGDAEVTRVVDLELRQFKPEKLYPKGWTGEPLAEPTAHLPEWSMDDVREHLLMSIHTWVIKDQGRVILVDTGAGNGKDRPFAPYFDHLDTRYLDRLTAAGAAPEDVDFVLITHVHVDHVGWNTRLNGSVWTPTFQNARYIFSREEHAHFKHPANLNEQSRTSFAVQTDSIDPLIVAGLADPIDIDSTTPVPGFKFKATPGHSPFHASIIFESAGQVALFAGDVMHHPVQVYRPKLNSVFDADAHEASKSREWALNFAADNEAQVFTSHFSGSSTGWVRRGSDGYSWTASE